MKPLYLLTCFYSSAATHRKKLEEINTEVRQVSNGDFRVLMMGTGGLMIGFTSDLDHKQLSGRFSRLGEEHFHYALAEVSGLRAGTMDSKSIEWLTMRVPRPQRSG